LLVYLCVVVYLCFLSFFFAFPHFRTANNIIRGRLNFRCNWCLNDRLRFKMRGLFNVGTTAKVKI
jgi:hypothetical protein